MDGLDDSNWGRTLKADLWQAQANFARASTEPLNVARNATTVIMKHPDEASLRSDL